MSAAKPRTPSKTRSRSQNQNRRLAIVIGLAGLAVLGFLIWPRPAAAPLSAGRLQNAPALGPADAPVTIEEYGDFGCTTCRGWEKAGVLKQILTAYPQRVRFVWHDFPVITAQSPKAAEAAQCAFDQGKFWEYHDWLYSHAPALSIDDLKHYAADLGLDTARFNTCLDSGQNQPVVDAGLKKAVGLGFTGTPAFLINGQPLVGAQPFDIFKKMIDAAG